MLLKNEFSREMGLSKDEKVRGEIIDQAQKLFMQYGLKKTTMDEIAAACGKAKSTLYHYYKSKEEVFDSVLDQELIGLRKIVKQKVDAETNFKSKITKYVCSFHEEVLNKLNLYRIVKSEFVNEVIGKQHFNKIMKFEQAYVTRLFEDAYDSGEPMVMAKEDFSWFAEILIAAFFGIVKYIIENDEEFDHEKLEKTAETLIPKIFG